MHYTIRPARQSDAVALTELLRNLHFFERLESVPAEELLQTVVRAVDSAIVQDAHTLLVAADEDDRAVGYCAVHWIPALYLDGPEGYLSELFVDEDARGHGVGGALLDALTTEARRRGCTKLQLINFKHRESYQREFYRKRGWEERPTAANFALYLE